MQRRILRWLQFSSICAILKLALYPAFGSCFSIWSPWPWDARVCVSCWIASIMVGVAIGLGELVGLFILVWFRKNVKVIQPEKVALLLKFKNVTKPKEPLPPQPNRDFKNLQHKPFRNLRFAFSELTSSPLCFVNWCLRPLHYSLFAECST